MSYIKSKCFNRDWIENQKVKIGRVDPKHIEKAIYAFELLGQLVKHKLDLTFKGGTALLLLLPEIKRLSIDLDIITAETSDGLEKMLGSICKQPPLIRYEENKRSKSSIPKKHYKLFYYSSLSTSEDSILLDVLFDNVGYPVIKQKEITPLIIEVNNPLSVSVPSVNSILGDKLTAFAPMTIGISFGINKSLQIIKQLFDIGLLFDRMDNLNEVSRSHKTVSTIEAEYRQKEISTEVILKDTMDTCKLLCQMGLRNSIENEQTEEIQRGIHQLGSFITDPRYTIPNAKIAASKTALLTTFLKNEMFDVKTSNLMFKQSKMTEIKDYILTGNFANLNSLKNSIPECFYYWYLAHRYDRQTGE